jgi:hypothetical protein
VPAKQKRVAFRFSGLLENEYSLQEAGEASKILLTLRTSSFRSQSGKAAQDVRNKQQVGYADSFEVRVEGGRNDDRGSPATEELLETIMLQAPSAKYVGLN